MPPPPPTGYWQSSGPNAGLTLRCTALTIDGLILSVPLTIIVAILEATGVDRPAIPGIVIVAAGVAGYFVYSWSTTGQTIGMRLLGIRVVDAATGRRISVGQAALRFAGTLLSAAVCYLGLIWVAFDANKRGWHDIIAKTAVTQHAVAASAPPLTSGFPLWWRRMLPLLILVPIAFGAYLWVSPKTAQPHITHHDSTRMIPDGFTDHVDPNLNVKVALPDSWIFGHEKAQGVTTLTGDTPKSLGYGWAFVSISRVPDHQTLDEILHFQEPIDPRTTIVDGPVQTRVAIPAGDAVRASWHYSIKSEPTNVVWITFYTLRESDWGYVITLSGNRDDELHYKDDVARIVNSFRILP